MSDEAKKQQVMTDEEDYIETPAETAYYNRRGMELTAVIASFLQMIVVVFVPLIICDILSTTSQYFKAFSGVGVYSEYSDSTATFFFGLDFTIRHLDEGFIPMQLFTAQWKAIFGITDPTGGGIVFDLLGGVTMVLTVLLFVAPIVMAVLYLMDRASKKPTLRGTVGKTARILSAAEFATVIWFVVIIAGLFSRLGSDTGTVYTFNIMVVLAYGAVKLGIEALLSLWLGITNLRLAKNIKSGVELSAE